MYQRTELPNGLRIVTEYIPYVRSISLGIWFEVGSRDEEDHERGYSHFIEHMLFKGTKKYSAKEISEIIDMLGGQLNAFTAKEHTCYYVRVLDEYLEVAADILKEMILESLFLDKELEKERSVIVQEINMYDDSPDDLVHDLLYQLLFPNHPLGKDILGPKENILETKRQNLLDYYQKHYTTNNLIIAAAGNVNHQQIIDLFADAFSKLPSNYLAKRRTSITTATGVFQTKEKDIEQVHLCLGGQGLARDDHEKYALFLLDTILGGGASSRLFQELREERGLVYSTYSYHSAYRETGTFGVYAGYGIDDHEYVLDILVSEIRKLATLELDEAEIERAKSLLRGGFLLSLESTVNRMMRVAKAEISERRLVEVDETIDAISQVTSEEVFSLAKRLLDLGNWCGALVGPVPGDVKFKQIIGNN